MLWVRNGWMGRVLAAMLIASMLPMLFIPPARAASGSQFGSYERWLRAQIRVSSDAVENAIADAVADRSDSLQDFVAAFVESYEAAAPDRSIAFVFTERELSNEALISFLQRRYTRVVDDAVLSRVYLTTATSQMTTGQSVGSAGVLSMKEDLHSLSAGLASSPSAGLVVVPFRERSSARPLGP